jgi:hypothetical protein
MSSKSELDSMTEQQNKKENDYPQKNGEIEVTTSHDHSSYYNLISQSNGVFHDISTTVNVVDNQM